MEFCLFLFDGLCQFLFCRPLKQVIFRDIQAQDLCGIKGVGFGLLIKTLGNVKGALERLLNLYTEPVIDAAGQETAGHNKEEDRGDDGESDEG